MPSEDTLLGNEFRLQLGSEDSPPTFADFCAISDIAGLGESKPQVDVTTLCDQVRAFRGGLAEGAEVTITANFIQGDAQTRDLFERYGSDEIVPFRLVVEPGSSPEEYFAFDAAILAWTLNTPVGEKGTMAFTLKISGGVTWVYT